MQGSGGAQVVAVQYRTAGPPWRYPVLVRYGNPVGAAVPGRECDLGGAFGLGKNSTFEDLAVFPGGKTAIFEDVTPRRYYFCDKDKIGAKIQ